jgi:uncharacterized 2Fe-2S/4Fe-4S cluster protein (DUF4445 family)
VKDSTALEPPASRVHFVPHGSSGEFANGTTLRDAARSLGVGIETICGGRASCAKCRVRVVEGRSDDAGFLSSSGNLSGPVGAELRARQQGRLGADERFSCQARLAGDVCVYVPEESRLGRPVVLKEAGERNIELAPAVRKCAVQLDPEVGSSAASDWERLRAELRVRFDLECERIDARALEALPEALREGAGEVTATIWSDEEVVRIEPGFSERAYGMAVDLGTTTIAAFLCDLSTGEIVGRASALNPQAGHGEDIMNRIANSRGPEQLERMQRLLVDGIGELARDLAAQAAIAREDIAEAVVVANTVMHHIFLGFDVEPLGIAPFEPTVSHSLDTRADAIGLDILPSGYVHTLPIEAGFVGADNVAVLIAEAPHAQDEVQLIIDIGTNGEIALGNRHRMLCASCPTGPALEGANIRHGMRAAPGAIDRVRVDPRSLEVRFSVIGDRRWSTERSKAKIGALGLCGSAGIDAVAELLRAGLLERSGRFNAEAESERLRISPEGMREFVIAWADETASGAEIVLTQGDVRAIQLAKAALYAGSELLLARLGVERPDRVVLAGAFGSVIDLERALWIGLFPDCGLENVSAVGNAAGDGARIALLDRRKRAEAEHLARWVEYVELSTERAFDERFVEATHMPHMEHRFPTVEEAMALASR